jgi:hypothetical protein
MTLLERLQGTNAPAYLLAVPVKKKKLYKIEPVEML